MLLGFFVVVIVVCGGVGRKTLVKSINVTESVSSGKIRLLESKCSGCFQLGYTVILTCGICSGGGNRKHCDTGQREQNRDKRS